MALPWLESFAAKASPAATAFPKRFGVIFLGNGVNEDHWGAEGSGEEMKLSKTLSPLEPLKKKINVIHGLFNKTATGQVIRESCGFAEAPCSRARRATSRPFHLSAFLGAGRVADG